MFQTEPTEIKREKYISATQTSNLLSPEPARRSVRCGNSACLHCLIRRIFGENYLGKCWVCGVVTERGVGTELTESDSGTVT